MGLVLRRSTIVAAASGLLALGSAAAPGSAAEIDRAWDREQESFLRSAKVESIKPLGVGVTNSHVVTLSDGQAKAKAVWKIIDEYMPIKHFDDGGFPELGFRDSYESEIAAYRLDRLIGLGQVPPTVSRKIHGDQGSLQLWIDDCMTEGERRRKGLEPPDVSAWNAQLRRAKVFFQLIHDVDFVNLSNLLIDPEFRLYKVDSSRAFRTQPTLLEQAAPKRYSRSLLDGLRRLDAEMLKREVGKWLSKKQRSSLLRRRDLILKHADRLVAEIGSEAALYP